jgi:hypothetical protein
MDFSANCLKSVMIYLLFSREKLTINRNLFGNKYRRNDYQLVASEGSVDESFAIPQNMKFSVMGLE